MKVKRLNFLLGGNSSTGLIFESGIFFLIAAQREKLYLKEVLYKNIRSWTNA
jgi:hypothetical protein